MHQSSREHKATSTFHPSRPFYLAMRNDRCWPKAECRLWRHGPWKAAVRPACYPTSIPPRLALEIPPGVTLEGLRRTHLALGLRNDVEAGGAVPAAIEGAGLVQLGAS